MESVMETRQNRGLNDRRVSRVSWGAIFGGTLIMLISLMLLSLLGIGIGIASINPMEESNPLEGIGTSALIWWVISNIIAVFVGAYTAATLTNLDYKFSGLMHGILTWSLFALISFLIMTSSIGGLISGVGGAVSKSLSTIGIAAPEIKALAEQVDVDTDRVNRLIQDALAEDEELGEATTEGKQFDIDLMAIVREVFIKDGDINANIDRQELVRSVARNSTLSRQDAERAADVIMQEYENIKQQFQELKQQAEETGQQVSDAVSKAAIWSFVALLLGVITAALGGYLGKPNTIDYVDTTARTTRRDSV